MKNFNNKETLQIVLLVVIAVVTLGIGYAAISAVNLIINGNATASVDQNNFRVHFTQAQSITGSTGVSGTSNIDSQDDTKAIFDVTGLTKVGDYAEAVYTVRNDSNGVGAEISLSVTNSNSEYFKVTETINDNKLQAGEETTAKVKVEMIKTPITDSVSTSITATLIATPLENESAAGRSPASIEAIPDPVSFSTDSWATIQKAVQNNNTGAYNVGDTKKVTINGTDYTVRIANKSTAQNCSDTNYSETACGFVVEFVDIITTMKMRDTSTNVGGYPATLVYDYLKNTLYGQLPSDLQAAIKPTRVISGHGSDDSTNFTTTDNLYLLSGVEVFGSDSNDSAENTTSQLEYYNGMKSDGRMPWCQTYSKTIKKYNDLNTRWLFRSSELNNNYRFRGTHSDGCLYLMYSNGIYGIAPAFRIG